LVSICLLTYNGRRFIADCLNSVLSQTYNKIELIVIDNNSQDDTVEIIQNLIATANVNFPIRIINNKNNLGFSAGHNLCIKESHGELVFLLNQDIILGADFVEKIVPIFSQDEKIGAVQGKLLRLKVGDGDLLKTKTIDNTGLVMLKNRRIIARGQGQADNGQFDQPQEIFGADGASPIFRRQALEEVKICLNERCEYLDEDFFAYKEDVDLAWRLRSAGWKAYFEPIAVAWHARSAGESAATGYFAIIKERLKIGKFAKYLAFKNQRLMQIKNEQASILLRHLPWFLPKEIGSWIYVILFERYTQKAIKDLFRQAPRAWQKRKIIMAKKLLSNKDMGKWFE